MLLYYNEASQIIQEVYIGKEPIEEMFLALEKFRNKYIGKPYNPRIGLDSDGLAFNRIAEKTFGFFRFSFVISSDNTDQISNFPIGRRIDTGDIRKKIKISKTGTGYKFDKDNEYVAMLDCSYGIFGHPDISNRELMALILHEIGHNFSPILVKHGGLFQFATKILNGFSLILSPFCSVILMMGPFRTAAGTTNYLSKLYVKMEDHLKNDKENVYVGIKKIGSAFGKLKTLFMNLAVLVNPITIPLNIGLGIYNRDTKKFQQQTGGLVSILIGGYKDEKVADTFVSIYGYSEELVSGMEKLVVYGKTMKATETIYSNKISGILFDLINIPAHMITYLFDAHPEHAARVKNQLDYLEQELKNVTLDPLMKKELQRSYDQIKSSWDRLTDIADPENRDAVIVQKVYMKVLYKYFQGDIRELFTNNKKAFEVIDKNYSNLDIESDVNESYDIYERFLESINEIVIE